MKLIKKISLIISSFAVIFSLNIVSVYADDFSACSITNASGGIVTCLHTGTTCFSTSPGNSLQDHDTSATYSVNDTCTASGDDLSYHFPAWDFTAHSSSINYYATGNFVSNVFNYVAPTPTPTPGTGGVITLDPTIQADLSSGIGSIGGIIINESIKLLPYILAVIGVFIVVRTGIDFFFDAKDEELMNDE